MQKVYPAHGWLPEGARLEWRRDDQGKDFATNWAGAVQAPGRGHVITIGSDRPFPNGFGPRFAIVKIDTGPFAHPLGWYIGHCTAAVRQGESFEFGHVLAHADQGRDWAGTTGGWVELGQQEPSGQLGPFAPSHWFDRLLTSPLVVNVPDPPLKIGDSGLRVLGLSSRLRDCGYLSRPWWHFNRQVHGAVVAFKHRHGLPVPQPDGGIVDARTDIALRHASDWCKKHHRHEV